MIDRRKFIHTIPLVAGAVGISGFKSTSDQISRSSVERIMPQKLKKGSTIGLITPASAVSRESFEKALENLESFGLKVKYSENMRVSKGFLAGTDQQRLDDLHSMFSNSEIEGIVCARGGYGSGRLLPHIDYELIRSNPKVLVGYSDITALLFAIYKNTGLVCFHGPVGASVYSDFTTDQFEKVLIKGKKQVKIERPKAWEDIDDKAFELIKIKPGKATGALIGGNLSLVNSVMGTPYDLDFDNKIVFLEDVGESPYRVDRMLTQILNSGKLEKAAALVLGVFVNCETKPEDPGFSQSLSLKEVLEDRLSKLNIPVIYGLPIGHILDNATLPIGVNAELDVDNATLKILEPGVAD